MTWDPSKVGLKKPADVPQAWWDSRIAEVQDMISAVEHQHAPGSDKLVQKIIADAAAKLAPDQAKQTYESTVPANQRAAFEQDLPASAEEVEGRTIKLAESTAADNKKIWADLGNLPLNELKARLGLSNEEAQAAHDKFVEAVNAYQTPEIPPALGDLVSDAAKAEADPESIAAQKRALGKAEGLTSIQETAEEKFMREQARRMQERDLRGRREADRSSLLARGAYGSGAEIAMNANAQQEAAGRRSLEELGANANAQQRALAAIGQMGNISGQMRDQSFGESFRRGTAADTVRNWNKNYTEDHNQWVRGQQVADEQGKIGRAAIAHDSESGRIKDADLRAGTMWGANLNLAEGASGNNTSGAGAISNALARTGTRLYNEKIQDKIDEKPFSLLDPGSW